jgi:hypothetical protein
VLEQLGLQRGELLGDQQVLEQPGGHLGPLVEAEHGRGVAGADRVLLPVGHARPRLRRQEDAGLGAVDPRPPRPLGRGHLAVLQLPGVLAQVPHVALGVLRVPVVGGLDHLAVLGGDVADDPGLDPHDRRGPVRDGDLDAPAAACLAVDPAAAGPHRPPGVVDHGGELGRVQVGRLAAEGKGRGGGPVLDHGPPHSPEGDGGGGQQDDDHDGEHWTAHGIQFSLRARLKHPGPRASSRDSHRSLM